MTHFTDVDNNMFIYIDSHISGLFMNVVCLNYLGFLQTLYIDRMRTVKILRILKFYLHKIFKLCF